jgi:hypothetical protein
MRDFNVFKRTATMYGYNPRRLSGIDMSALTFNTLKFANRLKTAGVPAQQAEAEAEALSEVFETSLSELATKGDLQRLEDRLDARMAQMKFEILRWTVGIALVQFGLLTGILLKLM